MVIIAVTGQKGGVGKTSISACLAGEFAAAGHRVRLLDSDPQKSLTLWAGLGKGILANLVEPVDTASPERFKEVIDRTDADRVIIDTPPGFADPVLLAALLADLVLLPVGPSPLDIAAAQDVLELVMSAKTKRSNGKPIVRLVPSKVVGSTTVGRDLPNALSEYGDVFPSIRQSVGMPEAAMRGLTIREYANGSKLHRDIEALAKAAERVLAA